MTHVFSATILTLGLLSPIFFSFIISGAVAKQSEEAKNLFFQWLSMVSGCLLTATLSILFYSFV